MLTGNCLSSLFLKWLSAPRNPNLFYVTEMDDMHGFDQKHVTGSGMIRQDQKMTTHKHRLLREGQLAKCH